MCCIHIIWYIDDDNNDDDESNDDDEEEKEEDRDDDDEWECDIDVAGHTGFRPPPSSTSRKCAP